MLTNDETDDTTAKKKPTKRAEQRGTTMCRKCRRTWAAGEEGCGHPAYETFEVR